MSNWKENNNIELENNKYLSKCKVCKKEVSKYAGLCPHCGETSPTISIKTKKKILIWTIVLSIAIPIGLIFFVQNKIEKSFLPLNNIHFTTPKVH